MKYEGWRFLHECLYSLRQTTSPPPSPRHMTFANPLLSLLGEKIPASQIYTDPFSLHALSVDASFYRLYPKVILDIHSLTEMRHALECAAKTKTGITLRAAGTSLSGQSQGEGMLLRISRGWKKCQIHSSDRTSPSLIPPQHQPQPIPPDLITMQPGVIGAHANELLKPYGRKIGPDPASIQSCMMGGIAANNASGMCCGTAQNTYQTLHSMKLLLPPQTTNSPAIDLDSAAEKSRQAFLDAYPQILRGLLKIRESVLNDQSLSALIQKKYKIKNTLGYSLNSFTDFSDPFDILTHLLVGSEGTLGFISEITLKTVTNPPHRASALMIFDSLRSACLAATLMATHAGNSVIAAELMDRNSLRSVENKAGMPAFLKTLSKDACALLIEIDETVIAHKEGHQKIHKKIHDLIRPSLLREIEFSSDPKITENWWNIRRGLFPSVGKSRPPGSTLIIEDVGFPLDSLAPAATELLQLLRQHGYPDAILFGHALQGNLHFVFAPNFNSPAEIQRYGALMEDLCELVAIRWKGSLKAEHGTGRNMAPFIEKEWGEKALRIMKEVKALLDPLGIMNPGVLLPSDKAIHLKDLKKTPILENTLANACMECGFCEPSCPSKNLTLTPRERISAIRAGFDSQKNTDYAADYAIEQTCATDGLCSLSCPVGINTAELVKDLREKKRGFLSKTLASFLARHFALSTAIFKFFIRLAWQLGLLPRWFYSTQKTISSEILPASVPQNKKAVYLPSCVTRTLIPEAPTPSAMLSLFQKGGIEPLFIPKIEQFCCGLAFESKGFRDVAHQKFKEFEAILLKVSENGRYPIVCDTSPCSLRIKEKADSSLKIYDSVEFIHDHLWPHLKFKPMKEPLALHITCSATRMGIREKFIKLANACSEKVIQPQGIGCCGFAGDKGFTTPKLNETALQTLFDQLKGHHPIGGASNSHTCEIGLTKNSGIPYQSIVYWVDRCTLSSYDTPS